MLRLALFSAVLFAQESGGIDSHNLSKMIGGTAALILIVYFLFLRKKP